MAQNKKVVQLDEITVINTGSYLLIYDIATAKSYKIKVDSFIPVSDQNFNWISTQTFALDEVTTRAGKWWQSLQNGNTGNIPTEGPWWTEVSKSSGSSLKRHQNGVYSETDVFVVDDETGSDLIYNLVDPTRPFNSTDFSAELAAGKWVSIGASGGGLASRTRTATANGANTISVDRVDSRVKVGSVVVIAPGTSACEFFRITNIAGTVLTLAANTSSSKPIFSDVVFITDERVPVNLFPFVYGEGISNGNATANTATFKKAIDLAMRNRVTLVLGDYTLQFEVAAARFFELSKQNLESELRIHGIGDKSVLYFPSIQSKTDIFYFPKDISADFRNFKVKGPEALSVPTRSGTYSIASGTNVVDFVSGQNFATLTNGETILNRYIYLSGAGAGGTTLRAYVTAINSNTQVVINVNASTTVVGANGYWYGSWDNFFSNNKVFNFIGTTFQQMGSGRSMTCYPGQKRIDASGFTFTKEIVGGCVDIYLSSLATNARCYVKDVAADGSYCILHNQFPEAVGGYSYTANTNASYYQNYQRATFKNVTVMNNFRSVMAWDDGMGDFTIEDCDWSCMETVIGTEPTIGSIVRMFDMQLNMFRSKIHHTGFSYRGDGSRQPDQSNGRLCYIGEGTGLNVVSCEFDGNYRTALSVFGGGNANVYPGHYRPVIISDSFFSKNLNKSIQTGSYQQYTISNCVCRSQVHIAGSARFVNTIIETDMADGTPIDNTANEGLYPLLMYQGETGSYEVTFLGGAIRAENSNISLVRCFNIDPAALSQEKRLVKFIGTSFALNEKSGTVTDLDQEAPIFVGNTSDWEFVDCNFDVKGNTLISSGGILRFDKARRVSLINCTMFFRNTGNNPQRVLYFVDSSAATSSAGNFFQRVYISGLKSFYWDGSKYTPSLTMTELVRFNNNVAFEVIHAVPNNINLNATSTALGNNRSNIFVLDLTTLSKTTTAALTSSQILNSNVTPVTLITGTTAKATILRRLVATRTSGTLNYATNTSLEIKYATSGVVIATIDLSALPTNKKEYVINLGIEIPAAENVIAQTLTGNPTTGDKALSLAIDHVVI